VVLVWEGEGRAGDVGSAPSCSRATAANSLIENHRGGNIASIQVIISRRAV